MWERLVRILWFRNIIHVVRVPPVKTFFPHFLGLTVGFVSVLTAVVHLQYPLKESLLLLVFFGAGSWLGTLFVVMIAIVALFGLNSSYCPHLPEMAQLYLSAYVAGWAFAVAYNWLVFVLLVKLGRRRLRLSFAYDAYDGQGHNIPFNTIKSPIQDEQTEAEHSSGLERLYNFKLQVAVPQRPYTIAFVANPRIMLGEVVPHNLVPDPIMSDRDLFLHTVDRALQSFEQDEVLGAAEIWSRVRVVTFFDPNWTEERPNEALIQTVDLPIGNGVADHFVDTTPNMTTLFFNRLDQTGWGNRFLRCQFDVIFVLSAWMTNCRSTARFSDYLEDGEAPPLGFAAPGNVAAAPAFAFGNHQLVHDRYATMPGRVALNVFSARTKTFIHEFAHAMSSIRNGAIADEYYDLSQLEAQAAEFQDFPVHINRLERPQGDFRVPEEFAHYGTIRIFSDMAHPSAEENWRSYFPERVEPGVPCTMDRSAGPYRFDRLISYFMYDRLSAKLDR